MILTILQWTLVLIVLGIAAWLAWEMYREKRQLEEDFEREFGMTPTQMRFVANEIASLPYKVYTRRTNADGTVYREGWCSGCNMPILPDKTCLCEELSLERYRRTKNYG